MSRQRICKVCGKTFSRDKIINGKRRLSDVQWKARKYCSRGCAGAALTKLNSMKRPELKDKFKHMFSKGEGCWNWNGTIDGYGYGVIDHNGKRYRAHVLSLEFDNRPVQEGMVACHHCDNPKCVRPDHLYVGTQKQNVNDAKERFRLARGIAHPHAKLTEDKVREARAGDASYTELARRYGVSRPTITKAIKGFSWSHVK